MRTTRFSTLFRTVGEAFRRCATRFPVTVVFVAALTAYLLYLVATEGMRGSNRLLLTLGYYFSVGTVLSLSLHLWSEEVKRRQVAVIVHLTAHILLVADALYLYNNMEGSGIIGIGIAHVAGVLAIGVSVFFLSFFRERDDIPAWYFSINTAGTLSMTVIIGAVMQAGISLLILSLDQLFGLDVSTKAYLYTLVLCVVTLPLLMFLGLLPRGKEKHDRRPRPNPFLNGIIRYLFLPLAGCYLAVLYVYAARILVRWELPDGWVSWLVVTLMTACVGIVTGLYPTLAMRNHLTDDNTPEYAARVMRDSRAAERVMRRLPALALPLLLLMSIGIARRFMDYGITINRLYLATLNVWFYFVCIGLIITKGKRISWIPVSFSVVFLLTSVLPVNYAGITRSTLRAEVRDALESKALPLSEEDYSAWTMSLPAEEADRINSKLAYLQDWYGEESVADLVRFDFFNRSDTVTLETSEREVLEYTQQQGTQAKLPQGYSYCTFIILAHEDAAIENERIILPFRDMNDTLAVRPDELRPLSADGSLPPVVLRTAKGRPFMPTSFRIRIWNNGKADATIRGYRFENDELITQKCD